MPRDIWVPPPARMRRILLSTVLWSATGPFLAMTSALSLKVVTETQSSGASLPRASSTASFRRAIFSPRMDPLRSRTKPKLRLMRVLERISLGLASIRT